MKNPLFYTLIDNGGLLHIFIRIKFNGLIPTESLIKIEKETNDRDDCGVLQDDNNIFCNFNPDNDSNFIAIGFIRVGIRLENGGVYKLSITNQS